MVRAGGLMMVIDTGPDFKDQALTFGIDRLDAVFITHEHSDHVMGMDDVRRFTWKREEPLPIYSDPHTLERLRIVYPYVSEVRIPGKAVPRIRFKEWLEPVTFGGVQFTSLEVPHAEEMPCCGVLIESGDLRAAYLPDCNDVPASVMDRIRGSEVVMLNALRHRPHPAHLTLERSLELLQALKPKQGFLTHMGCDFDYAEMNPTLPPGIEMAYDGLRIGVSSNRLQAGQRV
jgi:phosphoribosyl 1,2-cyclic phosphate phosphodiesterase